MNFNLAVKTRDRRLSDTTTNKTKKIFITRAKIKKDSSGNLCKVGPYNIYEELGAGTFGIVYKGMHSRTREFVCVKKLVRGVEDPAAAMEIEALTVTSEFHHCLSIKQILCHEQSLFIVTDYCSAGDLFDYCFPQQQTDSDSIWVLEEEEALDIFAQLILALEHVHSKGLVHGDVKLENIFLHSPEHIVLGDFGLATRFDPTKKSQAAESTTYYCPPEVHENIPIVGPESDVWSAGVVLFLMLHGRYPFFGDTKSGMIESIKAASPKYDTAISPPVANLLAGILEKDPSKRLTIPEIKRDSFMNPIFGLVEVDLEEVEEDEVNVQTTRSNSDADISCMVSRCVSYPVSKNDFNLVAHRTRALDVSSIPVKANPILRGRELRPSHINPPVITKKAFI